MNGLELVVGKRDLSGKQSVTIDNCFSTQYDNYLIVMHAFSGGTSRTRLWLRDTDDVKNSYAKQELVANNSLVGTRATSQSNFSFEFGGTQAGGHLYVYGPALPKPTAFRYLSSNNRNGAGFNDTAGTHATASAYQGITIYKDSEPWTSGSLTIYGFTK